MLTLQERIDAGVVYLDEHFPDWLGRLNEERLDAHSLDWCPMGQAAGRTENPLAPLGPGGYMSSLGFEIWDENYEELTNAWLLTIRRLRRERGK